MDVLVNATPLLAPLTGIGQYIRHLFSAMDQLPETHLHVCCGLRCETGMHLPSPVAARTLQGARQVTLHDAHAFRRMSLRVVKARHIKHGHHGWAIKGLGQKIGFVVEGVRRNAPGVVPKSGRFYLALDRTRVR